MSESFVTAIITAVVTLIGYWAVSRSARGGTKVTSQSDVIASLQKTVDRLEKRVGELESHDRLKDDYIDALRNHINQRKNPPPPPYPPGLVT